MEIERKWRLKTIPPHLTVNPPQQFTQGYILTWPVELRVRTDEKKSWLTVKSDGELSRDEWENEIPAWVFEQLFGSVAHYLEKSRYTPTINLQTWELDVFHGPLTGLVLVEAECSSEAEIANLVLPEIFGESYEVTHDIYYKNKHLAIYGISE